MKFNYNDVNLGDLDVEYNYINFDSVCDGDLKIVTTGSINYEPFSKAEYKSRYEELKRVIENELNAR